MASLIVAGDTSGTVTLQAPGIAGSTVLTLPTTSGTIVTTGGGASVPFAAGSAASPSITFTGDTNTGIFSPGADTIGFSEGGTEVMRLDSSGNLGVGTTSPSYRLQVANSGYPAVGVFRALDVGSVGTAGQAIELGALNGSTSVPGAAIVGNLDNPSTTGSLVFQTRSSNTLTERMRINSLGRVKLGDAGEPSTLFQVTAGSGSSGNWGWFGGNCLNPPAGLTYGIAFGSNLSQGNSDANLVWGQGVASSQFFGIGKWTGSAYTEQMRLTSFGSLLIGTTTAPNAGGLGVSITGTQSSNFWESRCNTTNTYGHMVFFNPNGLRGEIATSGNNLVFTNFSDYRLKENIAPMTGALAKVAVLKPVTYTWKENGSAGQGFIAHELAEVVPDCVTGEKDATQVEKYEVSPAVPATFDEEGNELTPAVEAVMGEREVPKYQGVDTSFLVATLTAAIQEQQAIITAMEARLTALENK